MVGVVTEPLVPEYANPEPTTEKLGRNFGARIDWEKVDRLGRERDERGDGTRVVPGVDVAAIQRRVGPDTARAPKLHEATYRIPIGVRRAQYVALRNDAIRTWLDAMHRKGWDLYVPKGRKKPIAAYPGPYPYQDLASGLAQMDAREGRLRAYFTMRDPEPLRIELDPVLVAPKTIVNA